jgi:hypothetical protein
MLSQTCSSLVCEHTWSIYDQVHSKRHSSVSRKRWNELTYVHYNLRLRERQQGRKPGDVISFDNLITENILDDWLVESDKQPMQEDEVPRIISTFSPKNLLFLLFCTLP